MFFGPIGVQLHLQALGQNNKPKNSKRRLGVVQLFLQRLFCIQRLQKRYVAGNAVTSNKIRQGNFLQEGQIFNTFVEISVLKFSPCRKQRRCLNFLLATEMQNAIFVLKFFPFPLFCLHFIVFSCNYMVAMWKTKRESFCREFCSTGVHIYR